MSPYAWLAAVVIASVTLGGTHWKAYTAGERAVQADWNNANADRAEAEKGAVLARLAENRETFRRQELDNARITKAHNDEIAQIRADLSRAPRLRIGSALCGGPASLAQTTSASGSNGANTAGRLVSESVQRDIDALKLKVEEAFAAGRACQAFVTSNGMTP